MHVSFSNLSHRGRIHSFFLFMSFARITNFGTNLTIVTIICLACRKRPIEATSDFDSAMCNVFQILMNIAKDFLLKSSSGASFDESEFEFVEYICESMVSLGSTHLQCLVCDSTVLSFYLQQVMFQSSVYYGLVVYVSSVCKILVNIHVEEISVYDPLLVFAMTCFNAFE